jgi:hypothetical protein
MRNPTKDWRLVGMADFDAHGTRDMVWHHQTGGEIRRRAHERTAGWRCGS